MISRITVARAAVSATLAVTTVADSAAANSSPRRYYVSCNGDDAETGQSTKDVSRKTISGAFDLGAFDH